MVSRSFGVRLTAEEDRRAAIASFTARAAEKLRAWQLRARALNVFIHTSPCDTTRPGYANALIVAAIIKAGGSATSNFPASIIKRSNTAFRCRGTYPSGLAAFG